MDASRPLSASASRTSVLRVVAPAGRGPQGPRLSMAYFGSFVCVCGVFDSAPFQTHIQAGNRCLAFSNPMSALVTSAHSRTSTYVVPRALHLGREQGANADAPPTRFASVSRRRLPSRDKPIRAPVTSPTGPFSPAGPTASCTCPLRTCVAQTCVAASVSAAPMLASVCSRAPSPARRAPPAVYSSTYQYDP